MDWGSYYERRDKPVVPILYRHGHHKLYTSAAVAASTLTTVDGQIILPTPPGQESLVPQSSEIFLHVNLISVCFNRHLYFTI